MLDSLSLQHLETNFLTQMACILHMQHTKPPTRYTTLYE